MIYGSVAHEELSGLRFFIMKMTNIYDKYRHNAMQNLKKYIKLKKFIFSCVVYFYFFL